MDLEHCLEWAYLAIQNTKSIRANNNYFPCIFRVSLLHALMIVFQENLPIPNVRYITIKALEGGLTIEAAVDFTGGIPEMVDLTNLR